MEFVKLENSDNSFSNDTEENPFEMNKKPIDFFPFEKIELNDRVMLFDEKYQQV